MSGFIAGPLKIKIGSQWYSHNVYVAAIHNDMLLGFDFLYHKGAGVLDMGNRTLTLNEKKNRLSI